MPAIIGRKLGMTQRFDDDGIVTAVTVIEAGPCHVTQVKTQERDGYEAVQLGFGAAKPKRLTKGELGHLGGAGAPPLRHLHEFPVEEIGAERLPGDTVTVEDFEAGQKIKVTGTSKGKGYAGTIKRHNFARGPVTHGSHNVRMPGSIGAAAYPARVFRGQKMSGRMGGEQVTQRGLEILETRPERNLLLVSGAVPGAKNSIVLVRPE